MLDRIPPALRKGRQMKSLHDLARTMLMDLGMVCGICTARDWSTVSGRLKHEGDEFLTITLPGFAKDFERSLELGLVADDAFLSFRKRAGLPLFLGGFLQQVFQPGVATLQTEPSIQAIFAVRQFTLAFGKILALPNERRQRAALDGFVRLEQEMKDDQQRYSKQGAVPLHTRSLGQASSLAGVSSLPVGTTRHNFRAVGFHRLVSNAGSVEEPQDKVGSNEGVEPLSDGTARPTIHHGNSGESQRAGICPGSGGLDSPPWISCPTLPLLHRDARFLEVDNFDLVAMQLCGGPVRVAYRDLDPGSGLRRGLPQHGPGATADRLLGNAKYRVSIWPTRLERCFPASSWLASSPSSEILSELGRRVASSPDPGTEPPTRVILVPKTSRTPRIIAAELTAHQYIQQALSRALVGAIERDPLFGPLIGFRDQEPNRQMAMKGSLDGTLATLDLSEASDRVRVQQVRRLLQYHPEFLDDVESSRALTASVPHHGVIRLTKFATMGSALTFPMEAMVFLAIVVSSIARVEGKRPTAQFLRGLHGEVRVYGDDIIVPSRYAEAVIDGLEADGLVVNVNKSFWRGSFRESCGGDFFLGQGVKPVRLRKPIPSSRRDAAEVASFVSFRNDLYEAGLWTTAAWCDKVIRRILRTFPITESTSPLLGRRSFVFSPQAEDICKDTHVPLVKGCEIGYRLPRNELDGYPALMKWFLHTGDGSDGNHEPLALDHLQRSGRPRSSQMKIKTRWRRPY